MTSIFQFRAPSVRFSIVPLGSTALAFSLTLAGAVQGQAIPGENFECDFSTKIGQCKAVSSPKPGGGFHLFTDALRCASVDYASDGRMRRLFMKEGRGVDDKAQSAIQIASCTTFASNNVSQQVVPQVTTGLQQQGTAVWQAPLASNVVVQAQRVQQPVAKTTVSRMTKSGVVESREVVSAPLVTSAFAAPTQNVTTFATAQPQVASVTTNVEPLQASPVGGGLSGINGKWCDKAGVLRLNVRDKWFEMHRLSGQTVSAAFSGRQGNAMAYRDKQLVSTFSGKIGLAVDGGLQWEDKVSPGFSTVHRLEPCEPAETLVTQNFN